MALPALRMLTTEIRHNVEKTRICALWEILQDTHVNVLQRESEVTESETTEAIMNEDIILMWNMNTQLRHLRSHEVPKPADN